MKQGTTVAVFVLAAFCAYPGEHGSREAGFIAAAHAAELPYAMQVSNEGGVKVTVTPRNLSDRADTWDFEVALDTHTKELSDDLASASLLIAGTQQQGPVSWEGSPPGGHHRKGLLHFGAIVPRPASVELRIRLKSDATPRVFRWALK